MTEILTESFCERCGTRYTFESSAPRLSRLGRVKTLSRGVKNFVMSDEASFSEALADARGEEELATTTHQLDAFHKTFNFCLTCRQYTCGDCWNVADGRCLTCAPMDGPAQLAFTAPAASMAPGAAAATNGHAAPVADENLWPEADLSQERLARALGDQPAVADEAVQDEVASQLEVDAAAEAFEAPESAEVEDVLPEARPISVDDAWAAAAAAQADGAQGHGTFTFDEEVPDRGHGVEALAAAEAVHLADAQPVAEEVAPIANEGALGSDFDTQASAAEQDATAEAAMDTALDFDLDIDNVDGVVPGQSLEDAIAAYEARLAEGDAQAASPNLEPDVVLAGAAALEVARDDAPLEAEPVALEAEPVALEAEPVALEAEPVALEAEPVALEAEPVALEAEPIVEDLWADLDQTVAQAALAAAAADYTDEPPLAVAAEAPEAEVVEAPPVVAHVEPERDDHELALAAFAAAALAAEQRDEEPFYEPEPVAAIEPVVVVAEPEPIAAVEPVVVVAEPEPIAAVEPVVVVAEPEPIAAVEPEPVVAVEPEPVAAIAAIAAIAAVQPEPVAVEAEPVAAVEPEPVAAVEPEPEPVAAEPEPIAIAPEPVAVEPEPVAAEAEPASRVDVVPQPTWPTTDVGQPTTIPVPETPTPAPASTPAPAKAPWLMVAPAEEAARAEPQWPATPSWRAGASNTDAPTTLAGRTLLPQPDSSALWAASAREVLSAPPVDLQAAAPTPQPCVQCGLSLSSSARFCRRCGARQG